MFLFATDLGFMYIKADSPIGAVTWLRETFGYALQLTWWKEM